MLIKPLAGLLLGIVAGLFSSASAEVSSRFTVENDTDRNLRVRIYNGDDMRCTSHDKQKFLPARGTATYGCTSAGESKCKVQFHISNRQICGSEKNACDKRAIKLEGGTTTRISVVDDEYQCEIDADPTNGMQEIWQRG